MGLEFCLPMAESEQKESRRSKSAATALALVPSPTKKSLRCYKEVNLSAFRHNVKAIQTAAKATGCDMIAVVKAQAYGHGAIRIAHECLKFGIKVFGVATVIEGIELRESSEQMKSKDVRIIVLGASVEDEYELFSVYNLDLMLSGPNMAESLVNWCKNKRTEEDKRNNIIDLQFMMDTGMTRIGFQVDECVQAIKTIHANGSDLGLKFTGLCTHFADAPKEDYTLLQFDRFTSVLSTLDEQKINVEMFHCENSKSVMVDVIDDKTVKSYMDRDTKGFLRTGGALYGLAGPSKVELKPMMSLYAQIREIEDVKKGTPIGYGRTYVTEEDVVIATLAIGYADGYPRTMSNKKQCVRIGDEVFDVAGRVCMDLMMVNLGNKEKNPNIKNIKIGDYAVLFGPKHTHEKNLSLTEMVKALDANYSEWEITCGLTKRCPIVYVD
eukprot:23468_1